MRAGYSPPAQAGGQRHLRAQVYAAEPDAAQQDAFSFCRAGVTWFYNEASASQLDRYRDHAGIESRNSLTYAVAEARKWGVTFPWHGQEHALSDVPSVMLLGALSQLSASWTRHLRALAQWGRRPHPPGGRCPSSPPRFRSVHREGSLYWQVQDRSGPRLSSRQRLLSWLHDATDVSVGTYRLPAARQRLLSWLRDATASARPQHAHNPGLPGYAVGRSRRTRGRTGAGFPSRGARDGRQQHDGPRLRHR